MTPVRALCRGLHRLLMKSVLHEWRAAELGRSALVFAPHQDDEALGCGGTIVRKRRAGADVKIVFVTDGSQSHAALMPPDEMKPMRAAEAIAAAQELEVDRKDVLFLDLKDGQLTSLLETGISLIAELLRREQPAEVFIPYYRDGPPDHLATTRMVLAALQQTGLPATVYEYPVWFWYHWPWTRLEGLGFGRLRSVKEGLSACRHMLRDFRCCVRIDEVRDRKRTALECHKSQVTRLVADPSWSILGDVSGGEFLDCFFQAREIFYRHAPASEGRVSR